MRLQLNTKSAEDHTGFHALLGEYPVNPDEKRSYNIIFIDGVAEQVPDGVGKFLIDQKLAKELRQVKTEKKDDAD